MPVRRFRNRWGVDIRVNGRRLRLRCPENSRTAALAYEAHLRNQISLKGPDVLRVKPSRLFRDAAEGWYAADVLTNRQPSVRIQYRRVLTQHLLPTFGSRRIADIATLDVEQLKGKLRESGLEPSTVNNVLIVLSKFFRCAVEWGWVDHRPRVTWLRVPPSRFIYLSHEECRRVRQEAEGMPWHDMIVCAYRTGMRLSELQALQWDDVDLRQRVIMVRRSFSAGMETFPKNKRGRAIPMTEDLHDLLARRPRISLRVFWTSESYYGFRSAAARGLGLIRRASGVQKCFTWHAFRHTFASLLVASGVPITTVQALMGHASIQMTMRYAHLAPGAYSTAIDTLAAAEQRELRKADGHQVGTIGHLEPLAASSGVAAESVITQ